MNKNNQPNEKRGNKIINRIIDFKLHHANLMYFLDYTDSELVRKLAIKRGRIW